MGWWAPRGCYEKKQKTQAEVRASQENPRGPPANRVSTRAIARTAERVTDRGNDRSIERALNRATDQSDFFTRQVNDQQSDGRQGMPTLS